MKLAIAGSDCMAEAVETWVLQAVVTPLELAGLCRKLAVERQTTALLAAGQSSMDRV